MVGNSHFSKAEGDGLMTLKIVSAWLQVRFIAGLFSWSDFCFHCYSVSGLFKDRTADAQPCVEYQPAIC